MRFWHDLFVGISIFYFQSSPRHSTDVVHWKGWQWKDSPFWRLVHILWRSAFQSYLSTNPPTSHSHSSSICTRSSCSKFHILKSSDASLSKVNLIILVAPWTWVSHKWYTFGDTSRKHASFLQCWGCKRWTLRVCRHLSVVDSKLKPSAKSILYYPFRARCENVSSI